MRARVRPPAATGKRTDIATEPLSLAAQLNDKDAPGVAAAVRWATASTPTCRY